MKKSITKLLMNFGEYLPISRTIFKYLGMKLNYKMVSEARRKIVSRIGGSFYLRGMNNNYLSFQLFWKGGEYYEPLTQSLLNEILKDKDLFIDVGANIGLYSINAAVNNPNTNIIAFECNPKMHRMLKNNFDINDLNIKCENYGISDKSGTTTLYISNSDMTSSLIDGFAYNQKTSVDIKTISLDEYFKINNLDDDFVMKLDIEGCEELALKGGIKTLAKYKPDIVMEIVTNYPENHFSYLSNLGYKFYSITDDGLNLDRNMKPQIKDSYFFSNYLISTKSTDEIEHLSNFLLKRISKVNLKRTSLYVNDKKIERIKSMQYCLN